MQSYQGQITITLYYAFYHVDDFSESGNNNILDIDQNAQPENTNNIPQGDDAIMAVNIHSYFDFYDFFLMPIYF